MPKDKDDQEMLRTLCAMLVLHAMIPLSGPSKEQKVNAAVEYADLLLEKLK